MISVKSQKVARAHFPIQILAIKATLWTASFLFNFDSVSWDDKLVSGMDFLANSVLQVPFFLMSLMRYITPTLDHMYSRPLLLVLPTSKLMNSGSWILSNGSTRRITKNTNRRTQRHCALHIMQNCGCTQHTVIQASTGPQWMLR